VNEYQENRKSQTKLRITPSGGASSSSSKKVSSPTPTQSNSKGKAPLNAPTQEESQPMENELDKDAQREKFLKDYPQATKMLKNIKIGEDDNKNLEILKQEFMNSGFIYTMTATHPDNFLKGTKKEGDCSTLAKAYVKIAQEYLSIKSVKIGSKSGDFFVPHGGKVLDVNNATGNVDNGEHWVFTNHYWVESPIGNIDLLFLGQEVNQSQWIDKTEEGNEDAINYRIFGDYKVYDANFMAKTLADKYATNLDAAQQGKEAAEAALKVKPKRSSNLLNCCQVM
jgi:hypothetical protein